MGTPHVRGNMAFEDCFVFFFFFFLGGVLGYVFLFFLFLSVGCFVLVYYFSVCWLSGGDC